MNPKFVGSLVRHVVGSIRWIGGSLDCFAERLIGSMDRLFQGRGFISLASTLDLCSLDRWFGLDYWLG